MAKRNNIKNEFEYFICEGQECVKVKTTGKHNYEFIVDKEAWDTYLSQYIWTVSLSGKRASVKTSYDNNTEFLWRMIIAHSPQYGPLDCWGTVIDHLNNNPLDNRLINLKVYHTAILNNTNISSKFDGEDRRYIHDVKGGYKIHYNLGGIPYYYRSYSASKYGSMEAALEAAKRDRDMYVIPDRQKKIEEMITKTRNVEFERGLRDKLIAGELEEIREILHRYGLSLKTA